MLIDKLTKRISLNDVCQFRYNKRAFCCKTIKKVGKTFAQTNKNTYLCNRLRKARAFSSAGLEHLPYKQRVGGSNPSTPTGVFPCGLLFGETAGIFFVYIPLNIIRHSLAPPPRRHTSASPSPWERGVNSLANRSRTVVSVPRPPAPK